MTYRTTRQADRDLSKIYIDSAAIFGLQQADRYLQSIEAALDRLAVHPRLARERREIDPPIRLLPCGSHLIAYLVEADDGVLIVRVLHARQNWLELLA